METPTGSARPTRTPTPRLSERKKQLFCSRSSMLDQIEDDGDVGDPLLGITPLKPSRERQQTNARNLFMESVDADVHSCSTRLRSSTSSSPETNKENKARGATMGGGSEEQLPHLFTTTMRLNSNSSTSHSSSPRTPKTHKRSAVADDSFLYSTDPDTDDSETAQKRTAAKRAVESSSEFDLASPQCKLRRTQEQKECIPTMAFYSHAKSTLASVRSTAAVQSNTPRHQVRKQQQRVGKARVISPTSRSKVGINKGVRHKIRKPAHSGVSSDLDGLFSSLRNEKLRQLISTKREERAKAEQVHEILRSAKDPIKMAKPLSVMAGNDANNNNNNKNYIKDYSPLCLSAIDFSDLSDDEEELGPAAMELDQEPVIPLIRHDNPASTSPTTKSRKFFKSGRRSSTCMEVRITDHIRASVSQGKISLVEAPLKKVRQVRIRSATIFSAEQATVDAILRNLDDTVVDEIVESNTVAPQKQTAPDLEKLMLPEPDADPYAKYHQQLPYKTNDPAIMEQQELLLEFLISNNICTDENFEIFIADPDNHKAEATRIVDKLYMVVNAEQHQQDVPDVPIENAAVQIETPPPDPQGKLFPIFTQRLQPMPQKSTRRKVPVSARLMVAAAGSTQYQIDAGQKAFGARQCQQCGLVYTVHEPEEEQLHREYHEAVHVLRFKGWIDEDIVAVHSDWSVDGRIIRINEHAPAARLLRLNELIRVVDKELGYSSYIVPKIFVAFFAVRKQQIVGMCLVQPLTQAHRFIQVDGTDYFSEETFEASCGVSRIWVSPLQRRQGIASKLLSAVQCHTILGCVISSDRIAFSTPTDDGRALARHFTQNDNFLTYDQ